MFDWDWIEYIADFQTLSVGKVLYLGSLYLHNMRFIGIIAHS